MVIPLTMKGQAEAFDELANILHIRRENITSLMAEKKHPLPLPPTENRTETFVFDSQYLEKLCQWAHVEKEKPTLKRAFKPDFATIETEIRRFLKQENQQTEWHVEEAIGNAPPGYFLG